MFTAGAYSTLAFVFNVGLVVVVVVVIKEI